MVVIVHNIFNFSIHECLPHKFWKFKTTYPRNESNGSKLHLVWQKMEVVENIMKILNSTCMTFTVYCCKLAQRQTYSARVRTLSSPGKQNNLGVPRGHEDDTYRHAQNTDAVAARLMLPFLLLIHTDKTFFQLVCPWIQLLSLRNTRSLQRNLLFNVFNVRYGKVLFVPIT